MEFNKQGRVVSDSMRLRAFIAANRAEKVRRERRVSEYRGMTIEGEVGKTWFVRENGKLWPILSPTEAKAKTAVDRCLAVRAEVAEQ